MKKIIIILLVCLPMLSLGQEKKKIEIKPYGFFKGDMVYATAGVYSWGAIGNSYLSAPQFAGEVEESAMGFTSQHSRFGVNISREGTIKVGGKIEIDFYGGAFDANGKPRIRQAYAFLKTGDIELRFGQQWDLFSPVNATTNNTNGNMWYAGNRGFRRPQIQFIYNMKGEIVKPKLQLSIGEGAKESNGLGMDNMSATPMFQGRFSTTIDKKYTLGIYFVYASFLPEYENVDTEKFNASGFGFDVNLGFHKYFSLKGELNIGKNLNNANLFNIAGNVNTSNGSNYVDKKSLGLWFNATSNFSKHFQTVIGFGMDKNQTDDLAAGIVESNTVIYGDLIFPIENGFSIAIEVQNITTAIKSGDNNTATIFNLSGKFAF